MEERVSTSYKRVWARMNISGLSRFEPLSDNPSYSSLNLAPGTRTMLGAIPLSSVRLRESAFID
jgi:hypothetical protein